MTLTWKLFSYIGKENFYPEKYSFEKVFQEISEKESTVFGFTLFRNKRSQFSNPNLFFLFIQ